MIDMQVMRAELNRDEGRVRWAYQDSEGYWTCGVGFLIDHRKGALIPDAVIDFWLGYEIDIVASGLNAALAWWPDLDDVRQRALVNMGYQMGVDGLLEFKTMLRLISEGEYDEAADDAARTPWAKETPERALRVITMIRTGVAP